MKKWIAGITAGVLLLGFSAVGFAKWGGPRNWHKNITTEQRAELVNYAEQKNKLHADFLNGEVAAGRMDKKEVDARITIMESNLQRMKEGKFERAPMSEEQKAAWENYRGKVEALRVDSIKKAVANGSITQEQGDRMLERAQNHKDFGSRHGHGGPRGDRGPGEHRGEQFRY